MPRLRTDDGPRKLRAVWLGPRGTVPVDLRPVCDVAAILGRRDYRRRRLVWLTGAGWSGPSASGCSGAGRPASGR